MTWALSLEDLLRATNGRLIAGTRHLHRGVGTDSRVDLTDKIFFALKGETFDAHAYLAQALERQPSALVIHDENALPRAVNSDCAVILVNDTLLALQHLSQFWRRKQSPKILAITGSNGKTTTKEFAATLIGAELNTHYSRGSFNNHWGVPLSLLDLRDEHQVAVIEMGMNHYHEIKALVEIAEPDVVLCTSVGRAHIGHFGSVEGIARAKNEIYESAQSNATGVFNLDDRMTVEMLSQWRQARPGARVVTFSTLDARADVYLQVIKNEQKRMVIAGHIGGAQGEVAVSLFGRHNVMNLAAAAAAAHALSVSPMAIWAALPKCKTAWGRNEWLENERGVALLFDAYNANPDSFEALLANLADIKKEGGRWIALTGEMREMGELKDQVHFDLGQRFAALPFDEIYFVGETGEAFKRGYESAGGSANNRTFERADDEALLDLIKKLAAGDLLVAKGSRGIALEKTLAPLKPRFSIKN